MSDTDPTDGFTDEELADFRERFHDVFPPDGVTVHPPDGFGMGPEEDKKDSEYDEDPSMGAIYDRMSEADRKKAFFFLLGIVEFYANEQTWFAVALMPDPPCGDIVRDFRVAQDGKHRPGGRARLAISWIVSAFEKHVRRKA